MSQLVSVTLLHQGSTAPVKNWRVAIKFPLSRCITFFSAVSYKRNENITKKMNLERKKSNLCAVVS